MSVYLATTIIGLTEELHACQRAMRTTDYSCTSVNSASELFMRFISRAGNRELEQLVCISFNKRSYVRIV
jgi:hypothetical protein